MVLVQTYGISRSHLNHRRQNVMVKLQTYGTVPPDLIWTTDVTYWDDCIHEIDVAQNVSDIRLLPSWPYFESYCDDLSSVLWYLQISFEPPTSIT